MTISAHNRKLLWGRSGSRCAMCQCELIMPGTSVDDESIIGDECHIVSPVSGGPRHDPEFPREKLNNYANLLLLCKVHHKLIDDQWSEYTASRLAKKKANHEKWVSEQLDSSHSRTRGPRFRRVAENTPAFLQRIRSGKELLDIVTNACAFAPHYDDLRNETEDDLVAGFLQDAQDCGELGLEFVHDRMRAARSLDEHIGELKRAGFWVFGYREEQILEGRTGLDTDWPIAHIQVLRDTNPEIIVLGDSLKKNEPDGP